MLHLASVLACLYKPEMNRYYKSVNIVYTNALREIHIYISRVYRCIIEPRQQKCSHARCLSMSIHMSIAAGTFVKRNILMKQISE